MSGPPVAVIGAGFGGLALAIRLQSAGIPTILFEQRDKPGGRAYVYEDQGFVFDAGPTVITAPNAIEHLFALSGRQLADYCELLPVDPYYRLSWESGFEMEYNGDAEAVAAQVRSKHAPDAEGYRRFLRYSEAVCEQGYVRLGHEPFLDWWSMVRALPQLTRLKSWRTVYGIVSGFIRDPELRQAFSFQSLLIGGNPFAVSSIYALVHALERRWGVWFPRGGTHALVRAMARLYTDLGGELRLSAPVDEIAVRGGRVSAVRTADGRETPVRAVASNGDVVHTYAHLLRNTDRGRQAGPRLERSHHSNSLFVVYFGLRRPAPQVAHHTVIFGPRYRELLADIFDRGVLADDFSVYLHNPTRTDPSLAPPGQAGFYALAPVPHLGKAPLDWERIGPEFADRVLEQVERRAIPGLRQDLVTRRIFTPLDFRRELNAHHGSAFSLEPLLTQSAWFRVHNRDPKIGGLYFVGAGTHPGAGVPGVVASARATAGLMLADLGVAQ
ncbi:MAG: phytoene desaturase [Gammaproteobacteria bacterium]|nr:phytoene desaturase [Gammaproteobacteria bacterium]